jgi:nickel-dependent lactate racemase
MQEETIVGQLERDSGAKNRVVRLPYGQRYLTIQAPRGAKILSPQATKPVRDPKKHAQSRLSRYFKENRPFFLGFKNKKVCVVVSDNTRYSFNREIVPILLKELQNIGIAREDITILIASGLHAPMSGNDLTENLGREVVDDCRIENHDPDGELVSLGTTKRHTPILLSKRFVESDLKIATGTVVPHFHAGFGGGYKSILPGISGKISILKNHSFDMVSHDKARYGFMEGNPIYEDIVEAGRKSGLHLIVNVTVNAEKKMTHLFIGEPEATHRRAAHAVTEDMKVQYDRPFDVVVTTNGGYPLDRNLYQCVKGLAVGEPMTRSGGTIILACECRDGVGHELFQKYMSLGKHPQDVLKRIKADEPLEDQDNIQILARILSKTKVIVVTDGVPPETIRAMKMEYAKSVEKAMDSCSARVNNQSRIAIVPAGPYVLPVGAKH